MKKSVSLTNKELEEAVADYVEKHEGFRPQYVSLSFTEGDRPFDADYWSATASE